MTQNNSKEILVFVYGTLKSGGPLNHVMVSIDATLIGDANIRSKDFILRDLGQFPGLQKVESGSGTYIEGELWHTNTDGIKALDKIEEYPILYTRDLVTVWVDNQSFKAIAYHIDPSNNSWIHECPVIQSGEWDSISSVTMIEHTPFTDPKNTEQWLDTKAEEPDMSGFTVDSGIYIVSEFGEYYGPYDSIQDACNHLPAVARESNEFSGALTIGFRVYESNMSSEELLKLSEATNYL